MKSKKITAVIVVVLMMVTSIAYVFAHSTNESLLEEDFQIVSGYPEAGTFSFPGINTLFNRDLIAPTDWSQISITDAQGLSIPVEGVNTTISARELQIYSSQLVNGDYTLHIAANVISDTAGNLYDQEITLHFSVYMEPQEFQMTTADGKTYSFRGINIHFNRDVIAPTDWSQIKIVDENGTEYGIQDVHTTISAKELQVYSGELTNGAYTLLIAPNVVSDMNGNLYDKEIEVHFFVQMAPREFELISPQENGAIYFFRGINLNFNRDLMVPTDWSGIQLLDSNGTELSIGKVRTTISPKELQIYSPSITNGEYTLIIAPGTVSDTDGNLYDKEIHINFSVRI